MHPAVNATVFTTPLGSDAAFGSDFFDNASSLTRGPEKCRGFWTIDLVNCGTLKLI